MVDRVDVKNTLKEFTQNTSAHGFSHMTNARNWFYRLIWLLLLGGAWTMICFQVAVLYGKYNSRPVSTKIDILNHPLDFPAVTVCNNNPVQFSKIIKEKHIREFFLSVEKYFLEQEALDAGENSTVESSSLIKEKSEKRATTPAPEDDYTYWWEDYGNDTSMDSLTDSEHYYDLNTFQGYDPLFTLDREFKLRLAAYTDSELKKFTVDPSVFIIKCSFGGKDCNADDFAVTRDYNYGLCYTYPNPANVNTSTKSFVSGPQYGLNLILHIQQYDYLPYVSSTAGVRVSVQVPGAEPNPYESGFSLSPGTEASISLKLETILKLGDDYSKCDENNTYSSLTNCVNGCLRNVIQQRCNCSVRPGDFGICKTSQDIECVTSVTSSTQEPGGMCNKCEKPCQETIHRTSISTADWPSDVYERALRNEVNWIINSYEENKSGENLDQLETPEDSRKNLLKLNIYYGELSEEHIEEEEAYSIVQFASDIGGQLGLWAGISVLSIAECIELFMSLGHTIINRLKNRSVSKVRKVSIQNP